MSAFGDGSELPVGSEFAGFRIEAVLGHGGMGSVYLARDLALDHDRALKVLAPALARNDAFRERFRRESRLAASIEHPSVVPVYHAGEEDGRLFMAMRLIRGPDVQRLVARDGPFEPLRTSRLLTAVAGALDEAHARGVVHRDVKPANIMIEVGSEGERFYLGDFGISRPPRSSAPVTTTGELLGTADYISPEQIEGEPADARSDVYALGCVACFLLTGEPPFARETEMATLYAHAHAARPRPSLLEPGLPEAVDEVVAKATAIDPADRHASAGEFAADFAGALGRSRSASGTSGSFADGHETVALAPRRRRRIALGVAAVAGALILGIGAWVLASDGDEEAGGSGGSGGPVAGGGDPAAPEVQTFADFNGSSFDSIVVGEVNVLAAAENGPGIYPVDPVSGQTARSPDPVDSPTAVAIGFGSVWATSAADDSLVRFGPTDRSTPRPIAVGSRPADVAVDGEYVWVANRGADSVSRVNPNPERVTATADVPAAPVAVATGEGGAWVASPDSGTVTRLDPADPEAEARRFELGGRPSDLVVSDGSVWVVDPQRARLIELDPVSGKVLGEHEAGEEPVAVAAGFGSIWVADHDTATALRFDSASPGEPEPVRVGKRPAAISAGDDGVWVAGERGTLTRITP